VKGRLDVVTEESEEAGNRERLVTVTEGCPVNGMIVVQIGYEGDDGINGYHGEDSDDAKTQSALS